MKAKFNTSMNTHGLFDRELLGNGVDPIFYEWVMQRRRGQSLAAAPDARIRCCYSRSTSSTLASGVIWTVQEDIRKQSRRRSQAEKQQVLWLVPRYLIPPSSNAIPPLTGFSAMAIAPWLSSNKLITHRRSYACRKPITTALINKIVIAPCAMVTLLASLA